MLGATETLQLNTQNNHIQVPISILLVRTPGPTSNTTDVFLTSKFHVPSTIWKNEYVQVSGSESHQALPLTSS